MKKSSESENEDKVRLDKWLWAARFFKTRSLALSAIEGGAIFIDGVRAKASRHVYPGLEIQIRSPRGKTTVIVDTVSTQRGNGKLAATFYTETEESKKEREALSALQKLSPSTAPEARPNTRERRLLRRMKER